MESEEKTMAWIELHQQLPTHPKTKRLVRALGLTVPQDIPQVVGHLCMFWLWCIDYAIDGSLKSMSEQDIADAAGWYGDPETFFNAMLSERFIDINEDGECIVHDWDDYIGRLIDYRAKERKRNAEKQRRHRQRLKEQKTGTEKAEGLPAAGATGDPFDISGIDPEWLKIVSCYERNIGLVPYGTAGDILASFYEDLGADVVCKAIEVTNTANANNPWKYLQAVLNKWVEQGINTIEKAEAYTKDLERRLKEDKQRRASQSAEPKGPPAIIGDFY